jgi:hypothetical protein
MMEESCDHDDRTPRTLFCGLCGKVKDPAALQRVRIQPRFTGAASMNPAIERFWETGEVEHL